MGLRGDWMADKPRLATIEIVFFLAAIFFAALNVHRAITWLPPWLASSQLAACRRAASLCSTTQALFAAELRVR